MQVDKFEAADFKYDNFFLKFYLKNTQISHFWSKLYSWTILRALISNMTMSFLNSNPKIPKEKIFYPKYKYCLFRLETLHIETGFKNGINFFQIPAKNMQIQNFPIFKGLFFTL